MSRLKRGHPTEAPAEARVPQPLGFEPCDEALQPTIKNKAVEITALENENQDMTEANRSIHATARY